MTRSLRITMVAVFLPLLVLSVGLIASEYWLFGEQARGFFNRNPWFFPLAAAAVLLLAASLSYRVLRIRFKPVMDLQERHQFESVRRRSIMDASVDAVLLIDSAGCMTYLNPVASRLLGIDALNEENALISDYLTSDSRVRMNQGLADAMGTGYGSMMLEIRRQVGQPIPVDVTLSLLSPPDCEQGIYVTVVMKDMSPQIRLAEEYKAAKEQAEESNRTKSSFLALISHEIRTPLHAIIGLSQLIEEPELGAQQQEYLNQIRLICRNVARSVNDLLDFSKLESDKLMVESVEFRLDQMLEHLKHMMLALVDNKPISIRISKDAAVPDTLIGDPIRIEQVLYNLTSNAIKFTEYGEIELIVQLTVGEKEKLYTRYTVRDSGIGMSEQQMEQMFIPYQQANSALHRQYGGTGLGLVIAKTLVELMGGKLDAESAIGHGSEFRFSLPLASSPLPVSEPAISASSVSTPLMNADVLGKVLLIEDHDISRMIATKMLRSFQCGVYEAENATQAFELLKDVGSEIDLVLMDLHMPGIDGIEAVRTIRATAEFRSLPIVIQTADTTKDQHRLCLAAGANEVITKPVELIHLKQVIERWIGNIPKRVPQVDTASSEPDSMPELEGLNSSEALLRVDGRAPFYLAMLNRFQERYSDLPSDLRQRLENEDKAEMIRILHTFRGSASHLSAHKVYEAATLLEESIKLDRDDCRALLDDLGHHLNIVFRSIEKYKESISLANISDTGGDLH